MMVEGIDYCFIYPKDETTSVHIRFLSGPYKDTVYKYGKTMFQERPDGVVALLFKLDVLESTVDKPKNLEKNKDFINYVGPLLVELMNNNSDWEIIDETGTSDTDTPDLQ
jgi:hypothetical protein